LFFSVPAQAKVVKDVLKLNGKDLSVPALQWTDHDTAPRAVLIGIHGSVQHAGNFAALAKSLAPKGIVVYSVDLRGHGDWLVSSADGRRPKVDYAGSSEDLVQLTAQLRQRNPGLPVFCIGESVGAAVALNALAQSPKLFDGLILASPGSKPVMGHSWKATCKSIGQGIKTLGGTIDLSHHLKAISDDPRSADEMINDPSIRKEASLGDLLHTLNFIKTGDELAPKIDKNVPVLVIQGGDDNIIRAASTEALFARLASKDKSIITFPKVGHLLVTTAFLKPTVVETVEGWLFARTKPEAPLAVTAKEPKHKSLDGGLNMPSSAAEHGPLHD
jgi:alpha-beta hydrolase superfamily lysophospholipase